MTTCGEFPQPSRPLNIEESMEGAQILSERYLDALNYFEENSNNDDGSINHLRGFMEEVDEKGRGMFTKFISMIENDVPIEKILHDFKGRHASDLFEKFIAKLNSRAQNGQIIVERGVNGDFSGTDEEEMKHKLERFKVKTVNVAGVGVVKEEEQS